ncbi:MAG: hypothetical protein RJA76_734 [Bacteroidota bacterium]|jgi:hypothetical protein
MKYLLLLFFPLSLFSQLTTTDFKAVRLKAGIQNKQFVYQVSFQGKQVIAPSTLGFDLANPSRPLDTFELIHIDSSTSNSVWRPVWGEEDEIYDFHKKVVFHLKTNSKPTVLLDIEFKISKEGAAFRYLFPKQENLQHFIVKDEKSTFHLSENVLAFWIPGDYDTNEYLYNTTRLSEVDALKAAALEKDIAVTALVDSKTIQVPLMLKSDRGLYVNIHEAALIGYPAMLLSLNKNNYSFTSHLVPDAVGNKAYLETGFSTPWRVINVAEKARDILSSRLIVNLNEPTKIAKTDWIKPQKYMGVWWEMHIGKGTWQMTGGKHAATTENTKKYIDFAAKHGFDGVLVEGWNKGWEDWFGNWKEDVFDFVSPYPDYGLNELKEYAKSKGVKLIMHHETSGAVTNYERRMDKAFQFMKDNEINTVKTGYVGKIIPRGEHHDSQWMVNHYQRVAEKAATYGIMVDAHEPVHPTGLHRTFPNWMSNEAARGTEFNNAPTLGIVPEHQTILPFTRLMGGSMDYTPGLFHFELNQFEKERKQKVLSTLAKQLALYITIYSPLQMAADLPENYEKHLDAFQFIKDVPVNWSETVVLEAEPGEFVVMARREKNKGNWYVGGITDEQARKLSIPLNFLKPNKKYQAILYKDGADAHYASNPSSYQITKQLVDASTNLSVDLAAGGGIAIQILEL